MSGVGLEQQSFGLALLKRVWSTRPSIGCPRTLSVIQIRYNGQPSAFSTEVAITHSTEADADAFVDWRVVVRAYDVH